MVRPSDILGKIDKACDITNFWNDIRKRNIKDEIFWIGQNYENPNILRCYILKCADFKNDKANELYARQLLEYPDEKVQRVADLRANYLYCQMQNLQNSKIDHKLLKIITHELKLLGR